VFSVRVLLVIALLLTSVSCSLFNRGERDEFANLSSEEQFYRTANQQLNSANFSAAVRTYQALESRFPFGQYASQAQLELIYAHFRSGNLEGARAAADRFIRLHPDHQSIDYAYYLKGVASFTENTSFISRFLPTDQSKRDISRARDAFNEFSILLALYPDSDYAADARARMIYLRNSLASHEINVANYYLERRAYIAALNRGRYVVENFQGSPVVADAVAIMVECYLRLGLNDLADTSLALLRSNYPNHPTLDRNGDFIVRNHVTDPSLLYTVSFGLLGSNTDNTPLAPTSRPQRSIAPETADFNQRRSLLNIVTFGRFGRGANERIIPTEPPPGTPTD
jgi:outer membrane protein assembly factor BamD